MFYSLLFSLFSVVSSYMISGGVDTAVSPLLARFFTVGKPRLVVVAVQGAPTAQAKFGRAWRGRAAEGSRIGAWEVTLDGTNRFKYNFGEHTQT